jgi:hypothetical protein
MAAGEECTSAACPQAFILLWNGTSWSQMTLPKIAGSTSLESISASSEKNAWAVGEVCQDKRGSCTLLVLGWNGSSWIRYPMSQLRGLYAVGYTTLDLSPTDAWIGGGSELGSVALNWNGHSWVNVAVPGSSGFNSAINEIAAIPGSSEVWAIEAASGGQLTIKWNGAKWKVVRLPQASKGALSDYDLGGLAASSPTSAWAIGVSYSNSGTVRTLILEGTGAKWTLVKSPDPGPTNELFGIATSSTTSALSVGSESSSFQQDVEGLAVQWNGAAWSVVKLPTPTVPATPTPKAAVLYQH